MSQDAIRAEFTTVKKKSYCRMHTSLGDLNLELHVTRLHACEKSIEHAKAGIIIM